MPYFIKCSEPQLNWGGPSETEQNEPVNLDMCFTIEKFEKKLTAKEPQDRCENDLYYGIRFYGPPSVGVAWFYRSKAGRDLQHDNIADIRTSKQIW